MFRNLTIHTPLSNEQSSAKTPHDKRDLTIKPFILNDLLIRLSPRRNLTQKVAERARPDPRVRLLLAA